ncbi:MAG: methylamine utilization protein [Pseudomonadales bacterium]|nr:methylamine utilization protein [Pseudomonadales bacterium]RLU04062.1 MAG: methylamine utilization protein [Ketobacter sp.]
MQLTSALAIVVAVMALGCFDRRAEAAVIIQAYDQLGNPLQDAVILAPEGYAATRTDSNRDQPPAIMDQIDKAFVPKVLTVEQGRRVNFPNSDNIRHHVYSFSTPKVFELKLYAKQPEHPINFEQAGIVVLGCNIHDKMIGFIVVSDTTIWGQTDQQGQTSLELPDNIRNLRVWHPDLKSGFNKVELHSLPDMDASQIIKLQLEIKPPIAVEKRGFGSDRFKTHGR